MKKGKPTITLAKSVTGPVSIAGIETEDGTIDLCRGSGAKLTCQRAAELLRQMASAFDKLAEEEKPFHEETQKRVSAAALLTPGKKS